MHAWVIWAFSLTLNFSSAHLCQWHYWMTPQSLQKLLWVNSILCAICSFEHGPRGRDGSKMHNPSFFFGMCIRSTHLVWTHVFTNFLFLQTPGTNPGRRQKYKIFDDIKMFGPYILINLRSFLCCRELCWPRLQTSHSTNDIPPSTARP